MKEIEFTPCATIEECYEKLVAASLECGEPICGEFNGTLMFSNESIEKFYMTHFQNSTKDLNMNPIIKKFATENAEESTSDFASGMGFWAEIERDKDGFAKDEYLDMMFANMPFLIFDRRDNDVEAVCQDDWRGEIDHHRYYTHWKPIPLPTNKKQHHK